ncbi:hypothetical protein BGW80DRAFT_1258676 [Lactifluus volemus]|nr:hypothetical protein BGW80DRAFT_1258676 [Lactifluus volemus]
MFYARLTPSRSMVTASPQAGHKSLRSSKSPAVLAMPSPVDVKLRPFAAKFMLYYDYSLTLSREIQFLWPPHNKKGWFTLACLLNRYLPLLGHLPMVITYFFHKEVSLSGSHVYHEGFVMVLQAPRNSDAVRVDKSISGTGTSH